MIDGRRPRRRARIVWLSLIGLGLLAACASQPRYHYFFSTKGGAQSMPITTPPHADGGTDAQNSK